MYEKTENEIYPAFPVDFGTYQPDPFEMILFVNDLSVEKVYNIFEWCLENGGDDMPLTIFVRISS